MVYEEEVGGEFGLLLIVIKLVNVCVSFPFALVTVSDTEYVPAVEYATYGLCCVEVDGFPPGKFQLQEVGDPAE
jgi:hypothetical protein